MPSVHAGIRWQRCPDPSLDWKWRKYWRRSTSREPGNVMPGMFRCRNDIIWRFDAPRRKYVYFAVPVHALRGCRRSEWGMRESDGVYLGVMNEYDYCVARAGFLPRSPRTHMLACVSVKFHCQGSGGTASFGSGGGDGPILGSSETADNDNGVGEPTTVIRRQHEKCTCWHSLESSRGCL